MASGRLERVRPSANTPVSVRIDGERSSLTLLVRDICAEGLALVLPDYTDAWEPGSDVALTIKLPGRRAFPARGVIRHDSFYGSERFVGVAITEIAIEHHELLVGYVQERLREIDPEGTPAPGPLDPRTA